MQSRDWSIYLILAIGSQAVSCFYMDEALAKGKALPSPQSIDLELTTKGAPGMSMATYGLVTKDLRPANKEDRAKFNNLVRTTISQMNNADNPPLSEAPINAYLKAANKTIQTYQQNVDATNSARTGNQQFGIIGAGGAAALAVGSTVTMGVATAVGAAGIGLYALHMDTKFDQQLKKYEAEYTKKMGDLLTTSLAKDSTLIQSIHERATNNATARTVLDELTKTNSNLKELLTQFPAGEARERAKMSMANTLSKSAQRASTITPKELKALENEAAETKKRVTVIEAGFAEFQKTTRQSFFAVETALNSQALAIKQMNKDLSAVKTTAVQTAHDVEIMQEVMWGKLSNEEKLYALDHGLMRKLDPKTREETRTALQRAVEAEKLSERVDTGLAYAKGAAIVINRLGGQVDIEQLDRNIKIAEQASALVSNIIGQNYLGAVMALGGLFGGDEGPDVGEMRHQQVLQKLDEVVRLQKETLKALGELSRQIADSTESVMEKLVDLEYKIDHIRQMQWHNTDQIPQGQCSYFRARAKKDYNMDASWAFPSYESRQTHFAKNFDSFNACTKYLDQGIARINPEDSTVHYALGVSSVNLTKAKNFTSVHWAPMFQLTKELLGAKGNPNCLARLLSVASQPPQHFGDITHETFLCAGTSDIPGSAAGVYRNYEGDPVHGDGALSEYLYFPSVRFIGNQLAFFAPYFELQTGDKRLLSKKELARGTEVPNAPTKGEIWMGQFLDITNIELAQETIYSGALLAKEAGNTILRKSQFGEVPIDPQKPTPYDHWRSCFQRLEQNISINQDQTCVDASGQLWGDKTINSMEDLSRAKKKSTCKDLKPDYPEGKYFAALCLMESNPLFRQNVVTYLVLSALEESRSLNAAKETKGQFTDGTEVAYRVAYYYNNPYWMAKLLPGLPIEWGSQKDGKDGIEGEGWHLKLRKRTGELWYVPLPSPYAVKTGMIAYSPVMREAEEYRNRIMQRYLFHSLHRQVLTDKDLSAQTKGQTLKLLHQIALYSRDTVMGNVMDGSPDPSLTPTSVSTSMKKTTTSKSVAVQKRK
ncbi:MAG TPA: hypothetical protein DDY39_10820 [Nitrospira sp.]|nr:hypothetical protein [Nitrospira sp.]HBR52003.1 hypothetical protein [Nitrospira sp.]